MFTIITENDVSVWNDQPGLYHFPLKYRYQLLPGTKVIYYKGQLREKRFSSKRLSNHPHYFAAGEVESIRVDPKSKKKFYAVITNLIHFDQPVYIKSGEDYIEKIPESKKINYWWDGVRVVDRQIYSKILKLSTIVKSGKSRKSSKPKLELKTAPSKIKSKVSKNRKFKGTDNDLAKQQAYANYVGSSGEQIVIQYEKEKLKKAGKSSLSRKVKKVKDGRGFDILSFDDNGEELHIEVKTTSSSKDEPFYLTLNELEYVKKYPDNYLLYRLFNFDGRIGRSKFYILNSGDLLRHKMIATRFEVSLIGSEKGSHISNSLKK